MGNRMIDYCGEWMEIKELDLTLIYIPGVYYG